MIMFSHFHFKAALFGTWALMAFLGLGLSSCHDETNNAESIVISEIGPLPTTDQLEEKFEGKAMIFGNDRTDFNGCLANRMTNTTNEVSEDVKAFIFTKGHNTRLTTEEATAMFRAYTDNATFVLIDPVKTDRTALVDTLQAAISKASAQGEEVTLPLQMLGQFSQYLSGNKEKIDGHTEAVAVNRNGLYVVRNLEETAEEQSGNAAALQVTESGDTIQLALAKHEYEPNGYDHGKSADMLVNWMTRCANAGNTLFASGATSDDGQMSAQMVTIQYTVGPTRALERSMLVEHNFEIYSLHKNDTNEDYYLVHATPTYHNSQLNTYPTATGSSVYSNMWTMIDKEVTLDDGSVLYPTSSSLNKDENCWYGPYFRGANVSFSLETSGEENDENITVLNALPATNLNRGGTLTSGLNCTLTNVSITNNSIWGGKNDQTVNFTQSFSHQDAGLYCLQQGENNNYREWTIMGETPERKIDAHSNVPPLAPSPSLSGTQKNVSLGTLYHSLANAFQIQDFTEDFTLAFVVKNPKANQSYSLHFSDYVLLGELYASQYNYRHLEAVVWHKSEQSIPLNTPVRLSDYTIECSDSEFLGKWEKPLKDYLKESLTTTWNGEYPSFSVFGNTETASNKVARHILYRFSQILYVVANRYNITDEVTFSVHAKGSTDTLGTFKLKDKNVSY